METFYWFTEDYHHDNNVTMQDYLENHLPELFDIILEDGTYAEIQDKISGEKWEVHASGNGDSYNHKIEFKPIF